MKLSSFVPARATSPRAALLVLLVVWTAYWAPKGWAHMQAESLVVQNGFGGDGVQMWEIFDLKMTVLYTVVRWLPGVAALGGAWWWVGRKARRGGAERDNVATVAERSLAA